MLFLGDMMFDRGVATNIRKRGSESVFASGTREITDKYDLVVANLEGPITTYPSRTIDTTGKAIPGFSFTFPTSTATLLAESGIDIVSLANNHADNFGREGLSQTIQYLKDAGIDYFGNTTNSPFDIASSSYMHCPTRDSTTTELVSGVNTQTCIAFIGYHQFTNKNESHILAEIARYETDPRITFTIVFPHWGVEYQKRPNQNQISLAHQWVDAGADLIIGAHPHVVQSTEIYKNAYIYYSLGNYIFDQYFSYDTTHGIAVGITLSPDLRKVQTTEIIPIDITGTIVRKANGIDSQKILEGIESVK
jgi:poly-gamma-glutamate synthesis protein (capsule biosynthesis protein)